MRVLWQKAQVALQELSRPLVIIVLAMLPSLSGPATAHTTKPVGNIGSKTPATCPGGFSIF